MATNTIKYLFGLRDLGLAGDFIKVRQYGFVYWAEIGDPTDETAQRVRNALNEAMFYTYQSITLPDITVDMAERRMQNGLYVIQPVSADIAAGEVTIEYLAPIGNLEAAQGTTFDQIINYADEAFYQWQMGVIIDPDTYVLRNLHPKAWQATIVYVMMRPDLREIWGGEILTGVTLLTYNGNYTFDAGTFNIRTVSATFRYLERIPLPQILNEGNTADDAAIQLASSLDASSSVKDYLRQAIEFVLSKFQRLEPIIGSQEVLS